MVQKIKVEASGKRPVDAAVLSIKGDAEVDRDACVSAGVDGELSREYVEDSPYIRVSPDMSSF